MKNVFIALLLGFSVVFPAAAESRPFDYDYSKVCDVIDYPEIPGYGILPFKVFQSREDWKCILKDGRLFLKAIRKTTIEKELDNDLMRQKLSFNCTSSPKSSIMLTVYVTGAQKKVNLIREKITGNCTWSREISSPHFIKNTKFESSDHVNEHVTADKIRIRLHLNPGASVDVTSLVFTAITDKLTAQNTPFKTFGGSGITSVQMPENPDYWQLLAASRLRKYLFLQTGKLLPFTVGKAPVPHAVNIGFSPEKAASDQRNCFYVSSGKNIMICANRTHALVHGAYELLERCGFRFYSRFHQVIPQTRTVVFPEFTCKRSTPFTYRHLTSYGDMIAMGYGSKKLMAPAIHGRDLPHHNDIYIVPSALFETKPELFAIGKDGRRRDPRNRREQPKCYSNPEVKKLYKEAAIRYLKAAPHAEMVLLSTCDFHNWCQCSRCRSRDKEGSWTAVFMEMINSIAAEIAPQFPDKKIMTYAYTYTAEPAAGLKMHPNVLVQYAFYKPYFTSDTVNDSYGNREGWRQLEMWQKIAAKGNISAFVYPTQFSNRYSLVMPFTATSERIRYCRERNFDGFVMCGVTFQFEALMTWIWGKMFWDPDVDVQALIKEHMEFFYGKESAPYMVEYFNRIYRHVKEKKPSQYCEFPVMGSVTPELLNDLHALLDKAIAAAPASGRQRRALLRDKAVLLYTELNDYNINNSPLNGDYGSFACKAAQLIRLLGKKESFTNYPIPTRLVSDWFSFVTGVKIKNKKHWLDPAMQKFLAAPEVKPKQLKTVTGRTISPQDFKGGQYYPNRPQSRANICIRRASSPWSRAVAHFSGTDVSGIDLCGMTELPEVPVKISVNGKILFNGKIKFDKGQKQWGNFQLSVPGNILNKECNELVIENTTPDPEGNAVYTYGWVALWKVDLLRKN